MKKVLKAIGGLFVAWIVLGAVFGGSGDSKEQKPDNDKDADRQTAEVSGDEDAGGVTGNSREDIARKLEIQAAADAPYLSERYLQYYIYTNGMDVHTFKEAAEVEQYMNSYSGGIVQLEEHQQFFKNPYYAMTKEDTELLYMGQMKDNKPHGIGAVLKLVYASPYTDSPDDDTEDPGDEKETEEITGMSISEYSPYFAAASDTYMDDVYMARVYMGYFNEGQAEGYGIEYSVPGDDDYYVSDVDLQGMNSDDIQSAIFEAANPRRYEGGFSEGEYSGPGNEYRYIMENVQADAYAEWYADYGENVDTEEYADALGEEAAETMQEFLSGNNKDIEIYAGSYAKGKRNGDFKIYSFQKLYYEGGMKNDEENGFGIMYYGKSDQIRYEGEWTNGKYNGEGTSYNKDGTVAYSGKWAHGDYAH